MNPKKTGLKNLFALDRPKEPRQTAWRPEFLPVLKKAQEFFKTHQTEFMRYWRTKIPMPYSMGNELEFRFWQYDIQKKLLTKIILEYVPADKQKELLESLPKSPIEELSKNGEGRF